MWDRDKELACRVRDIIVVIIDDIDAVTSDVEDGVVYIEGVVSTDEQRHAICRAVHQLDGLCHVITCLATERILPSDPKRATSFPPQVLMHYHSLS